LSPITLAWGTAPADRKHSLTWEEIIMSTKPGLRTAIAISLIFSSSLAQGVSEEEMLGLGATEAARLIREGSITSTELVSVIIRRAKERESLNAYITLVEDLVLKQAGIADMAIANGEQTGRLHGVPIAVKDNIEVAGLQHTAGTPGLIGYVPDSNAPVIQALIDEGAIILGKNNMHELAMGITSNNAHFGAVGNAYNPEYFAGGSSGGTGAAVAANIATAGMGSDTGGSVRIPASVNGVYGLRPTTLRYSQTGITPLSNTRDTAGPIAKSVADLILMDAVINDSAADFSAAPAESVRLGVPTNYYFEGVEQRVDEVIRTALERLAAAGIDLVEVSLPGLAELHQATGTPITRYESRPLLIEYLQDRTNNYISLPELAKAAASPGVRAVFNLYETGEISISDESYSHALNIERPRLQGLYADTFEKNKIDAIVFPTTLATAKPVSGSDNEIDVDGRQVPTFLTFIHNTSPGSLAGIPGVTLPAGLADDGLPVGLGLDGPEGSDARLLAIALTIEEILDFEPLP
jgi:mandelamide amidase